MKMRLVWILSGALAFGQGPVDRDLLAKIRAEAMERSQAAPLFDEFTVSIGPRLTASPAHKRAAEFARERLAVFGLENASAWSPFHFGRGWTLEHLTIEMTEPRYFPFIGYADAWSPSTSGEIVATPVWIGGKSPEEVAAMGAQLKGAIVMTDPIMTNFIRKDRPQPSDPDYVPESAAYATAGRGRGRGPTPAQRIAETLRSAGIGVILKPRRGEDGDGLASPVAIKERTAFRR